MRYLLISLLVLGCLVVVPLKAQTSGEVANTEEPLSEQEAKQEEAKQEAAKQKAEQEKREQARRQQASKKDDEGGVFKPSEEISEDLPAPFPVDI